MDRLECLRSVGLAWLNGGMAVLCGVTALAVTLIALFMMFIGVSDAIHWPQNGINLSHSGFISFGFHNNPALITVSSDVCTPAGGHAVCRRVSTTHLAPVRFDASAVVTIFLALIFITPLLALSYGLVQAAACFTALARGHWFNRRTITHLRNFALGGLVFLALRPVVNPMVIALNSAWGSLHHWVVTGGGYSLDLGPMPALLTVIYAVALAVITAVLAHARKVAEDHAQIV